MDLLKAIHIYICYGSSYVLNVIIRLKEIMCLVQSKYLKHKFYEMLEQRLYVYKLCCM